MEKIGSTENLKKLDSVLEYLFKCSLDKQTNYEDLENATQRGEIKVDRVDIQYILDKLLKDGYIMEDDRWVTDKFNNGMVYRITFEGRILVEQNGYEAKVKEAKIRQERMEYLNRALVLFGGVAALYYLIEMLKLFCQYLHNHPCASYCY